MKFLKAYTISGLISLTCFVLSTSETRAQEAAANTIQSLAPGLKKHEEDKSRSRIIVLPNKLKVMLISDPDFNRSAASLDVKVGSASDPKNRPGLAHFLEHMLFLGTEKYPDVEEYSRYLKQKGGYSNAFTSSENTNYFFQVHHDALEGALDRFSQFFIAPLFSPEYIEREMNAVHSEYQKNLMNDSWRKRQLLRDHLKKGHPANSFAIGNKETLKGVKQEEFKNFHRKYYSANQMALAVLSTKSLDEMERMVRKYFAKIPNKDLPRIRFDPLILEHKKALRLIQMKPVKDQRTIALNFPIPGFLKYHLNKPVTMIGFCIGHEGKGSLLSYLKDAGLASTLSAGGYMETNDYGMFSIRIGLTAKGLAEYKSVITACFAYIDLLKKHGVPPHSFDEEKNLAALRYTYDNKGEGTSRAMSMAIHLNTYEPEYAENESYIYTEQNKTADKLILDSLTPDNLICMLVAKSVKTDKKEKWYGTEYSYLEDPEFYKQLLNVKPIKELQLPRANPFISKKHPVISERPARILNEPGMELWYSQDVEFKRPKLSLHFRVEVPREFVTPQNYVKMIYYASCINEQLNEFAYEARETGLDYSISTSLKGIDFTLNGYSSSATKLFDTITQNLKTITIDEARFSSLQDRITRGWQSFLLSNAWEVARLIARKIRHKISYLPDELLANSKGLTLDKIKAFPEELYKSTRVNGMIHGNIDADQAIGLIRKFRKALGETRLTEEKTFKKEVLIFPMGTNTYSQVLPTNNSVLWSMLYLGRDSAKLRAATRVIYNMISQPYYTEMRTKQQLGYIVFAVVPEDYPFYYLFFIIQSGTYTADQLKDRSDKFIMTLPEIVKKIPDAQFEKIKEGARQQLLAKPKSISGKESRFFYDAFEYNANFDRRQEELAALESLTRDDVWKLINAAIQPKTRKAIDVLLYAKDHKPSAKSKPAIKNIKAFKTTQKFFEVK